MHVVEAPRVVVRLQRTVLPTLKVMEPVGAGSPLLTRMVSGKG
jgi:hypothetical protein